MLSCACGLGRECRGADQGRNGRAENEVLASASRSSLRFHAGRGGEPRRPLMFPTAAPPGLAPPHRQGPVAAELRSVCTISTGKATP